MLNKIKKAIRAPWLIVSYFRFTPVTNWLPDRFYLDCMYKASLKTIPRWKNPINYTEKLQWLKLYDHNPIYTQMVDKYMAKEYVRDLIGDAYIIPTIGVYDSFDEINFDTLPDQFVMKCTHDSAGLVICKNKRELDIETARKKINKCLKRNYFYSGREWPYKNVVPRIIIEKYMVDDNDGELRDYKFFTFGGVPKVLYITQGRGSEGGTEADFFDMDFNHLDMKIDHEHAKVAPHIPINFEKMKKLAAVLSQGTPQLRVDFYEVNGNVYFGELTFFHDSGFDRFTPESINDLWGQWVELPSKRRWYHHPTGVSIKNSEKERKT